MTETGHEEAETGERSEMVQLAGVDEAAEHDLGHTPGVTPVMVDHLGTVILLDSQQPPAQGLPLYTECGEELQLAEHLYGSLQSQCNGQLAAGHVSAHRESLQILQVLLGEAEAVELGGERGGERQSSQEG